MGEAKRRKKLDPSYGKSVEVEFIDYSEPDFNKEQLSSWHRKTLAILKQEIFSDELSSIAQNQSRMGLFLMAKVKKYNKVGEVIFDIYHFDEHDDIDVQILQNAQQKVTLTNKDDESIFTQIKDFLENQERTERLIRFNRPAFLNSKKLADVGTNLDKFRAVTKQQNQEGLLLSKQLIGDITPTEKKHQITSQELRSQAFQNDFYFELLALHEISATTNKFNQLRLQLFLEIAKIIEYGDDYHLSSIPENIKKIATEIHNNGGTEDMYDPLIWMFVPKNLHQQLNSYFDGIGQWKA